jgi:hypothetical protein
MIGRGVLPHVFLLALAGGLSLWVWTRDKKPATLASDVTVWSGRAADIDRIAFDSKARKVSLEARKDPQGRYFLGKSDALQAPPPSPHGGPAGPSTVVFVSVAQANKLAEALAPLKGVREIGRIGDDRSAEFGMKEPEGTLSMVSAGKERKLTIGAHTSGGADRYVRDEGSGVVYVVKGDVTRDLESGDATLSERDLHDFKDTDIEAVHVVARGRTRDVLRRGPESKRIWADRSDLEKADETATNWMAKIDRLRPTEYLAPQPDAPEIVVRIEYKVKGASGAFFEMAKVAGGAAASPPKPDYIVRSERTRLWAKAYGPVGEQVEQDLGSILK